MSHTYSTNTNSTQGGAVGLGQGGTFYDKADNNVNCPANQTVKVDVVNPYNVWDNPPGTYDSNTGITVTVRCKDDFSGVSDTYSYREPSVVKISSPTKDMKIGLCCKDMAGNTVCPSHGPWNVRYYSRDEDCGAEEYNSCATSGCGVKAYKTCANKACGSYCKTCTVYPCNSGINLRTCKNIEGQNWVPGKGCCSKTGTRKTSCSSCGSAYNSCATSGCGVKSYNTCADLFYTSEAAA